MTRNQRLAAVVLIRWAPFAWAFTSGVQAIEAATEGRWLWAAWRSLIPVVWLASIEARRAYYRLIDNIDSVLTEHEQRTRRH